MTDLLPTAEEYRYYAQLMTNAHYAMAESAKQRNWWLGVPVTIASTIVGTSIFATFSSNSQSSALQIVTGLLSLAAAVLSALHTFFNWPEIAAQHKAAAADFETARHRLDMFIVKQRLTPPPPDEAINELTDVGKWFDDISKRAPTIPDDVYNKVKTRFDHRFATAQASNFESPSTP